MNLISEIVQRIFSPRKAQATPNEPPASLKAPESDPSSSAASAAPVDLDAILSGMAAKHGGHLNWQSSIVDLLKTLDLDSSLNARKQLAEELGYTGDTSNSASMNVWLLGEVMKKLIANGGRLPDSLKH